MKRTELIKKKATKGLPLPSNSPHAITEPPSPLEPSLETTKSEKEIGKPEDKFSSRVWAEFEVLTIWNWLSIAGSIWGFYIGINTLFSDRPGII